MRIATTFQIEEVEAEGGYLFKLFSVTGTVDAEAWTEAADCPQETDQELCDYTISRLIVTPQNGGEAVQYETLDDTPFAQDQIERIEQAAEDAVWKAVEERGGR